MQLFYVENLKISNQLSKEESNHCLSVLRKKNNDVIYVTDGNGIIYSTNIESIDNKIVKFNKLKAVFKSPKQTKTHNSGGRVIRGWGYCYTPCREEPTTLLLQQVGKLLRPVFSLQRVIVSMA